jgi:hypothetical protein
MSREAAVRGRMSRYLALNSSNVSSSWLELALVLLHPPNGVLAAGTSALLAIIGSRRAAP